MTFFFNKVTFYNNLIYNAKCRERSAGRILVFYLHKRYRFQIKKIAILFLLWCNRKVWVYLCLRSYSLGLLHLVVLHIAQFPSSNLRLFIIRISHKIFNLEVENSVYTLRNATYKRVIIYYASSFFFAVRFGFAATFSTVFGAGKALYAASTRNLKSEKAFIKFIKAS